MGQRHRQFIVSVFAALLMVGVGQAAGEVCAVDDRQQRICLEQPAERIAALSPGATELVYASGAGDKVVAVVAYSDYPPAAAEVPSVGSHTRLDLERLIALQPDLVIGWVTGNPQAQLAAVADLGIPVFFIEPRTFEGVSSTIERLATLAGTVGSGFAEADRFRKGMKGLAGRYEEAEPVSVFYQVWDEPLMTVNDQHLIGKVITLCGGTNVFGDLERLVPRISDEAVLAADPEAILAGGMGEENRKWLERWAGFARLDAVQKDNLYFVPPSLIQRPTPRLLQGSRLFCEKLDQTRTKRVAGESGSS